MKNTWSGLSNYTYATLFCFAVDTRKVKPWQRNKVTNRRKRWLLKWRLWWRPFSREHAAAKPDLSRSRLL